MAEAGDPNSWSRVDFLSAEAAAALSLLMVSMRLARLVPAGSLPRPPVPLVSELESWPGVEAAARSSTRPGRGAAAAWWR